MTVSARYDAIVVGAGMSGLAAGIRLAQFEKRVLIVERHTLWGGLNSFYKRGGRRLDTGLHALTNFAHKGQPGVPLTRILRQLRLSWDELALAEQTYSQILFPGVRLRFENGGGMLADDVAAAFPAEKDRFARLVRHVRECDPFDASAPVLSARAKLAEFIEEPLLVEMLLCALCIYGSAREDDIDWDQFVILFRSIFLEGFARPAGGVKGLLDILVRRYKALGGELKMKCGVREILHSRSGAGGVVLEDDTEILADHVFSSAGAVETLRLCGRASPSEEQGQLSFFETIAILSQTHAERGFDATISFVNASERFRYRRPDGLVDLDSAVLCCSDNYKTNDPPTEGVLRVTVLADPARWFALGEDETRYIEAKEQVVRQCAELAAAHLPDPRPHVLFQDSFTPRTIRHYTAHDNGAVYGSPNKHRDGASGIENLHLIGTDQGMLGIVGSMLSGIMMANRYSLAAHA